MSFLSLWWPFGRTDDQSPLPANQDAQLRYGRGTQLVGLQPSILRWGLLWAALSVLYSAGKWLPGGTSRTVFFIVLGVVWVVSGVLTVILLFMQSRRRERVNEPPSPPAAEDGP